MKLGVLVSTMNRSLEECLLLITEMKISSYCTIVNQCGFNDIYKDEKVKIIFSDTIGLSKSRNIAINESDYDICVVADDDVIYNDNYEAEIINYFEKNSKADIVINDVISLNENRRTSKKGKVSKKINFLDIFKVASVEISFRRKSVIDKKLKFDELFGAGAVFTSGEENIFLIEAYRCNLNIYYSNLFVGVVTHYESTWFKGYNQYFFEAIGAFSAKIFGSFYFIYIIQFAYRKYSIYKKHIRIYKALLYMYYGANKYKNIINEM